MRAAAGALGFLLAACSSLSGDVDATSADLLAEHGLEPAGATSIQQLEIGDPSQPPWVFYAAASQQIGLAAGWDRGATLELRTTPVRGSIDGLRAHVLMEDGRIVGAWLSHPDAAPGIYALDAPP
jgi:hypothetical protein